MAKTTYYKNDYGFYFFAHEGEKAIYLHWIRITTDETPDEVRLRLGEDNESGHIGDIPDWWEEVMMCETLRAKIYRSLSTSLLMWIVESGSPDDDGFVGMDYEGKWVHWLYYRYDRILKFVLFGVREGNYA